MDPQAGEALKIGGCFDALTSRGVGLVGLLRAAAVARLGLAPSSRIGIIVSDEDLSARGRDSAPVSTRFGMLFAAVGASQTIPHGIRVGLGTWVEAGHAPESWLAAGIAFRLTDEESSVVDATDMGAMLLLVKSYNSVDPHEDVVAMNALDPLSREILLALVASDSIRAVAAKLAMHHSTLQAR